ncbi:MAG: MFS transporter [Caulobacteraceae bacterium]
MATEDIELGRLIDEAPLSALQVRVVALCALAAFLDGYDIQAIALSLPLLAQHYHRPPGDFVVAITASLAGMATGAILLAPLADRWGRKPVIVVLMVLIGLTSLAAAFTSGIYDLAGWRFATGLGIGACIPVASTLVAEYAPRRRRAAMITLMSCSVGFGAMIASFVAPMLSAAGGWPAIFLAGGVLPLAMAALLWIVLPESLEVLLLWRPADPRIGKIVRAIAPAVDPARVWASSKTVERQSVLAVLAPAYRARTLLVWLVIAMNLFVTYVIVSWLPTLMRSAGWSVAAAQRSSIITSLAGIVGGLALSWAADRGRPERVLAFGYCVTAVALGLFLVTPPTVLYWGSLLAIAGAGSFGSQFTLTSVTASYYPAPIRATGMGWISAAGRTGSIAGPTIIGLLMASLPPSALLGLLTAPMLACAAAVTLLPWALKAGGGPPVVSAEPSLSKPA